MGTFGERGGRRKRNSGHIYEVCVEQGRGGGHAKSWYVRRTAVPSSFDRPAFPKLSLSPRVSLSCSIPHLPTHSFPFRISQSLSVSVSDSRLSSLISLPLPRIPPPQKKNAPLPQSVPPLTTDATHAPPESPAQHRIHVPGRPIVELGEEAVRARHAHFHATRTRGGEVWLSHLHLRIVNPSTNQSIIWGHHHVISYHIIKHFPR